MSEMIEELAEFHLDPWGFVLFAFPWGEEGTDLEHHYPEDWQREYLQELTRQLHEKYITVDQAVTSAIRFARTSGHGVGKSALVAWIIWWAMSTFEDTIGVVTANTDTQLKTKTWVQVAMWYRMLICRDMFRLTATAIFSNDPAHERTWRLDMVPWSERNTEAFAGLHNQGKRILLVFDEASAIPDLIWEVAEGALTDKGTQILWLVFGNPTRNKGRFRECFEGGKFTHRWTADVVDSRQVTLTNKLQIMEWINDYGEDSDFVRIRVLGKFPRVDAESFIGFDLAREASIRDIEPQPGFPVVLGVDVGRFGDDPSVIYPRQGRDARSRPVELYAGISTMDFARKVVECVYRYRAEIVFVDAGGVGGGVVDRLRMLQVNVIPVDFGAKPDGVNPESGVKYANKRAEIWGALRDWLDTGAIPERISGQERSLVEELCGPNYGLNNREEILLESKKEMRRRGEKSPNMADALAMTLSMPTMEVPVAFGDDVPKPQTPADFEYNPYERARIYAT